MQLDIGTHYPIQLLESKSGQKPGKQAAHTSPYSLTVILLGTYELAVYELVVYLFQAEYSGINLTSAQFEIMLKEVYSVVVETHYVYEPKALLE